MKGIKLETLVGPNHSTLRLAGPKTLPEKQYWEDHLSHAYPQPTKPEFAAAKSVLDDLRHMRQGAAVRSLDDLHTLVAQHPSQEADYLFAPLGSTRAADDVYIIPLVGLRLSALMRPDHVYAVMSGLRILLQPDAHHLYFVQDDFFLEADRALAALPPFTMRIEYDEEGIAQAGRAISKLCREAH